MGYNFMYFRLKRPASEYPFKPSTSYDYYNEVALLPEIETTANLFERMTNCKINGSKDGAVISYWWNTPDGGSLDILLDPERLVLHVDTHAHWRYVLELYLYLKKHIDSLYIIDNQSTYIYDENSYRRFIIDSYGSE